MKRVLNTLVLTFLAFLAISTLSTLLFAEELSKDRQREIIQNYMIVAGQMEPSQAQSIGGEEPCLSCECGHCKCGTPHILEFMRNYDKLDRGLLQSMGVRMATRPVLGYYYDSPGGWVKIHYEKNGSGACWQPNVDTDGDGHPDYIEALGACGDSVFERYLNQLGYPRPLFDTAAPGGEDARIDVYLIPLPAGYYGQTWGQGGVDEQTVTAWVEIDHDFQHLPQYVGRPLDAARVTMAHELFHTIHFAIDVDESPAWREMSAVFMEEYMYDYVNDYLLYGPYFFGYPERSLQSEVAAHNYASVLFPLYLNQVYGVDIIRDIWLRCGGLGRGDDFLAAADASIDSISAGASNFYDAMAEWSVWNFFTGPYAGQAPDGIGYDEAADLDFFEMDVLQLVREQPSIVLTDRNERRPQFNGVEYLRLENLDLVEQHRRTAWYTFGDTIDGKWSLAGIYQLAANPDSHIVVTNVLNFLPRVLRTLMTISVLTRVPARRSTSRSTARSLSCSSPPRPTPISTGQTRPAGLVSGIRFATPRP